MASVFTKILQGEIPSDILWQDDDIFVIQDINPKAKLHLLIIPTQEIPSVHDITQDDTQLMGKMIQVAKQMAEKYGVGEGYQLHYNVGEKGGQEVPHVHLHLTSDL